MKSKKINNQERGAAAVEFALILPLLVVLVFGIIEFSILFFNQAMITNASREGARAGIVYKDASCRPIQANITSVVNKYCASHLITFGDPNQVPVTTVSPPDCSGASGNPLTVTVTYNYDFLVLPNLLWAFFSNTEFNGQIPLDATTVMRME